MRPGQQQGSSCRGDFLFQGVHECRVASQAKTQRESGGRYRRPLYMLRIPVPVQRGAVFVANLQVAVPSVALVQWAGLAVLRVQVIEQTGHFGQQSRVVRWRRAGQSVPADGAVRVFALVKLKKLQCHDR